MLVWGEAGRGGVLLVEGVLAVAAKTCCLVAVAGGRSSGGGCIQGWGIPGMSNAEGMVVVRGKGGGANVCRLSPVSPP